MKSSDEKVLQADLNLENSEAVVIIDHFITQLGDTSSYEIKWVTNKYGCVVGFV